MNFTCRTCPYWNMTALNPDVTRGGDMSDPQLMGECRIDPPKIYPAGLQGGPSMQPGTMQAGVAFTLLFPQTMSEMWCGKHPQFPAPLLWDRNEGFNRKPSLAEAQEYAPPVEDNDMPEPLRVAIETGRAVHGPNVPEGTG